MTNLRFRDYRNHASRDARESFRSAMESAGYFAFYAFVEDFREELKRYAEADIASLGQCLERARADFPNPGRFSPSWEKIWDEFDAIFRAKNAALADIPHAERDGEWQVLIDNPYMPQQVVCYPGLAFSEAVYMYAYFQRDLKPNEFLRLQKVTHVRVTNGNKEASLLPDV